MAVKDFDYFMWTMTQVIEQQVVRDLKDYHENFEEFKDAPEVDFEFKDFKYVDFEYHEKKKTYIYKGYTMYGGVLFRLDFETSQEDFDQEVHDYIVNYDYNSLLEDPWTAEELEEHMEKPIAK